MNKHIEVDFRGRHLEDQEAINFFKSGMWLIVNKEDLLNNSKKAIDKALEKLNDIKGNESYIEMTIYASADGSYGIKDYVFKEYKNKDYFDWEEYEYHSRYD